MKESPDYEEGHSYEVNHLYAEDTLGRLVLEHRLYGKNLVARFLEEGRAQFCCTLISTSSAYREIFTDSFSGLNGGKLSPIVHKQVVEWDQARATYPILFQSAIIVNEDCCKVTVSKSDGLHEFWQGVTLDFPKRAILAMTSFFRANDLLQSILRIRKEENLVKGSFEVEACSEDGFYFEVRVEFGLFDSLLNPGGATKHRDSIYAAALAQGLQILHEKYQDRETWIEYQNLVAFYGMLEERNLPTWDADEFLPNQIVAHFHPHELDTDIEEE